ncbi:KAT8 regulatory NSL complex subunit 1 isoform X2 [Esox lucius]|uniref:KAT8 regulatory NSL complex subunit 1 isoform X2 n=1 Tax=Esox lucius TaxID=8010 RepID=UPI0005761591|nr:KAT8 regulatory NSL complex subunit 1 isoform X2 [Esox lucius]
MAAMAPALTDAPAEAHHIRFKLAAPSSSLSPGSAENNGNAGNILIHSSGAGKRKVSAVDENSRDFCGGNQEQAAQQSPASALGKFQPLVASYLCSDVTPVPSTKESVKLQSVIIKQSVLKTHGILPSSLFNGGGDFLLRKRQTLELTEGQLKSLMNSGSNGGGQAVAALNGLAKKLAMSGAAGTVLAVNGSKPSTGTDSQPLTPPPDTQAFVGGLTGHILLKGTFKQKHSPGVSQSTGGNGLQPPPAHLAVPDVPTNQPDASNRLLPLTDGERAGGSQQGSPVCSPAPLPQPPSTATLGSLDTQVKERTLLNHSRQGEIEGRLRRLRKRLQVVQAKQVERHVQQQLSGFIDSARSMLPPAASRKGESTATWRMGPGRHSFVSGSSLGRFLKSGSVPTELERLYLSGTANLHTAESAFDSDVTESSSGGDTDLEEDELARVDVEQRHVKIWKRAESRYTAERASIISHWNWLQAHISDLEYRIRQQTDVYRQIRTNKGLVELGGTAPSVFAVSGAEVKAEASSQDCHVTVAESGLWRTQNGRPVNGVLNRVTESNTKHQPSSTDSSCVAARTRPLLNCRRRRLVHPNTVPNLNGKRTSLATCLCRVNPSSCVTCGGRPSTPREEPQYDLPSLERLSRLDPAVHPILSLPDDVCVSLRLQQVMKSHWQGKAPERSKPPKKLSLKHKLSSKDKHSKTANSLTANRLSHYKSRAEKLQRRHHHHLEGSGAVLSAARLEGQALCKAERLLHSLPSPSAGPYDRAYCRKRPREHLLDRSHDSTQKLFLDSGSPCSSLASMHSSLHSPSLTRQLSTSSESSTPMGLNNLNFSNAPPIRRRRGESSFDINNIVIPMSVAATTRVEKLQYKEILTPSWREVDIFSQPMAEEENDTEMEDLSDAAFSQLHQPCQDQERSRWTWMALAPAKRRGSRSYKSMDGRTTPLLCGTNPPTPQPASPDPGHCPPLHDYSHVASPVSPASPDATSNPHTPCSRDSHSRLLSSEDTRCSTPDFNFEERTVAPWEHRNFPLPEDPAPEPEVERGEEMKRARERSISGCPSTGYDTDSPMPCDDDVPRQKGHSHQ